MGWIRRPSPAMVVAVAALVVGLVGSAVAGPALHAAKKSSKHADKRADIALVKRMARKLSVRRARRADAATTAGTATNAKHAVDSATLGGLPASAFLRASKLVESNGLVKLTKSPTQDKPIAASGPFGISAKCEDSGGTKL